jgi:hypothetical protein
MLKAKDTGIPTEFEEMERDRLPQMTQPLPNKGTTNGTMETILRSLKTS